MIKSIPMNLTETRINRSNPKHVFDNFLYRLTNRLNSAAVKASSEIHPSLFYILILNPTGVSHPPHISLLGC